MARPRKNNADYFSHESEMRNDVKIKALRRKFSHTGYAVWNYLLEVLTNADGFSISWNDLEIELYAADFDLETNELTDIVDYCLKLGLLQMDGNMLFCENLISSFSSLMNKRGRDIAISEAKTPQKGSFGNGNPSNEVVSEAKTDIVEKSIVEYSKVNNTSPRARESASAPSMEERYALYEIFFWRNMKDPQVEFERFLQHNEQYGWKLNNSEHKRIKAAEEWTPEQKGARVSQKFLSAWLALYKKMKIISPDTAREMLNEGSRLSVNNGAVIIHATRKVQDYIKEFRPDEIMALASGNPLRFSWP